MILRFYVVSVWDVYEIVVCLNGFCILLNRVMGIGGFGYRLNKSVFFKRLR